MKKKILIIIASVFILGIIAFLSLGTYTACGCGGCGGVSPILEFTLNPREMILNDQKSKVNPLCNMMGCSICRTYIFFRLSNL